MVDEVIPTVGAGSRAAWALGDRYLLALRIHWRLLLNEAEDFECGSFRQEGLGALHTVSLALGLGIRLE